jgi:hypothetical protein
MSENESVKREQSKRIPKMQFIGMRENFIRAFLPTIGLDRGLENTWSTPNLNFKNTYLALCLMIKVGKNVGVKGLAKKN